MAASKSAWMFVLVNKQICPLLWNETLYLSSQDAQYASILENITWNKSSQNASAWTTHRKKHKRAIEICLPVTENTDT